MSTGARSAGGEAVRGLWTGAIIDADVHIAASYPVLVPYLDAYWREFVRERRPDVAGMRGVRRTYPPGAASTRADWITADGRAAGSDLGLLSEAILDPLDIECCVANCYFALDAIRHPDFAAAMASAINDWLIDQWLSRDARLRASLVVPARNPPAMIKEIRRVGDHPGFVQVLMPVRSERPYGNRQWHQLLEAIAEHDLVFGLHFGGTADGAPTPAGFPNHYFTEYVAEPALYWAQITSLIAEGAFQQVPALRVSVLEGGFTWLPHLAWRLTKEWRGMRRDIPWVDVAPTELIRRHFRFSVAPLDCDDADELASTLERLGSDELLMFATDYPHWHDDDLVPLVTPMSQPARAGLFAETARSWYRL